MITIKLTSGNEIITDVNGMTGIEGILNDRSNDFFNIVGEIKDGMGRKLTMRHIVNKRQVVEAIGKE